MSSNNTTACSRDEILSQEDDLIIIPVYAILTGLGLLLAYTVIITQFRLWHTNPILTKIPHCVNHPAGHAITIVVGLVTVIPYRNDLYIIWLVVLSIVFDNVLALANYSLFEPGQDRLSREYVFLYNCAIIGSLIIGTDIKSTFFRPLVALWSLLVLKFIVRLFNYKVADRAYGIKNTNLIADYMETEHTLSNQSDQNPQSMRGYKYLVIGEEKVDCKIQPPLYTLEFKKTLECKKTKSELVTLERVWECNTRLLDPKIDKDGSIRDVCLSFALFKLIKRRFFGFSASESQKSKTKQFILEGLLSHDKERVFRVIKTEMGFLRDLFYTRYPVSFAFGFPVFNLLILIAMCGVSIWISAKAFNLKEHPGKNVYWIVNGKNVDYRVTNGLLILIIMTETFEVLSYVFSDWMKVMMICRHVRSTIGTVPVIDRMSSLLIKLRFSTSLKNTIGQYSLLKSYNKGGFKRVTNECAYRSTCTLVGTMIPQGMKADKSIVLPAEVKEAIFDALKLSEGEFDDRIAPLRHYGLADDLSWLTKRRLTPLLTVMVWHVATSLCEIDPLINQPIMEDIINCLFGRFTKYLPSCIQNKKTDDELTMKSNRLVASSLSKYCAYLLVFSPQLLIPTSIDSSKQIFNQIVVETLEFFKNVNGPKAQYEKMMKETEPNTWPILDEPNTLPIPDEPNRVIDMGAKLGRYLMTQIPDDATRWKVMAGIWSELILCLAPYGQTDDHKKKLASGGEFITHLWALLYHAGIGASASEESQP